MSSTRSFAAEYLSVVASALFVVMSIAFITIPYSLGEHPGEDRIRAAQIDSANFNSPT